VVTLYGACTHFFPEFYGIVLLKNSAAGKKFPQLLKRFLKTGYFAGIDYPGILFFM
jgi:hypothetical protein